MRVAYICDRKKCERCSSECLHTLDYEHALHKNYIPDLKELFEVFSEDTLNRNVVIFEKENHTD